MKAIILFVASERKQSTIVLQQIVDLGYKSVDQVSGESEALDSLSKKQYTMAIITLDKKEGKEGVKAGMAISTQTNIPIIYLGEDLDPEIYMQLKQTRPWAFLSRPLRNTELQIAIENILQRQSHLKLPELEKRWHTLLNNLPGLAYQCLDDHSWTMWFLSNGCKALTGYDPSDIVLNKKISYQELIHPDDREMVRELIKESKQNQFELIYRINTKQGQEKWVLERGIRTDQILKGNTVLEGVIVDIDEQMQAELNLQLSLNELKILNSLNTSANQGIPTKKIITELVSELKLKFGVDTNLYFLDKEKNMLLAQNSFFGEKAIQSFEQTRGQKIPDISIKLVEGSWHHSVLYGSSPYFSKDPSQIKQMISDFTANSNLHKLITIQRDQIKVRSVFGIVLTQANEPYGLMTIRSSKILSEKTVQSIITVSDGISNIIARKITEEKLIHQENRYRMLWEMAPSGIIMLDSSAYVKSINSSFSKISGYSESEIINKQIHELPLVPKKSIDEYLANFSVLQRKGRSRPTEFQWVHKNGTLKWGEAHIRFIKKGNKIEGIQAIITDITQRKSNELKLKESEDLYRTLITKSPMSILLIKDGKVTFANPTIQKLMGVKKSGQLLGSPVSEIVDSENNPDFKERLMRLSDGSSNKPASFKMNRQDQKEVFLELSSVPVVINRENASLVMGRDITKQTVAEEKLRENEKLLSSILQAAPIGIGLVKERVFFWVNDAFVKMLGYSRRELIGQSSRLIYPDHEHYERAGRIKYRQLQLEPIGKVETKFRRKNGEVIDVLLSSVALNTNDISAGTTFTAVDISQRNLSEMILKENEERYRTLFENMAQGVFYQASDGTLLNVNKAALKMLGVTKTQFLGKDGIPPKGKVVNENMEEIPDEKHPVRISLVSGKKVKDKVIGVFNPRLKKFVWLLVNTQPQFRSGSAKPYQVFVTLHDLTEIKNAEIELKKSYEEIKKLSRHTEEIREEERKQIARNLHDELGQILTATKMDVSWIKNKLKGKEELLVQRADATLEIIDQAIKVIQQITSELRPPILDNLGLYEALKSLVADFHNRTGLLTYIKIPEKETPLNPDFNISLYRIIQEALTNVIRHAQAGQIRLKIIEKNNTLEIQISDNGKGIQEEKVLSSDSLGLIGIKERVIRWKGEFSITGNPEEGTKLRISFPLSSINKN